ncbi:MAG: hypothetical protein NTV88_02900 [Candidatus Micrarchaeota archaeon]|nr:hypothetical protein [Candidatus Micrarchaeota archaeon]
MASETYAHLNKAWKSTCKVLLGGEVGDMARYENYLSRYSEMVVPKKSSQSGKEAYFSTNDYLPGAKFISQDELSDYQKKIATFKLDINTLKDLDSISTAADEVADYCGDAVLGNSQNVEASNRCFNSVNVYRSQEIYDSKYVAFSSVARSAEFLFGSNGIGETRFGIRNFNTYQNTRCFECDVIYNSTDCYYVATSGDCTHCFFSFNQRNTSYCIGNRRLPKDQYLKLRDALLEQVRSDLEGKKDAPGIIGLLESAGNARSGSISAVRLQHGKKSSATRIQPNVPSPVLDASFAETAHILLGKRLGPLIDYRNWLYNHVSQLISVPSAINGKAVYAEPLKYNLVEGAQKTFVKLGESFKIADEKISEEELGKLSIENAAQVLEKIVYFTPEAEVGTNINVSACAAYGYAINALECWWPVKTKNAAYCGWSRESENTYGCSIIFSSKFCIKCFNSVNLNRCFEVSDSNSCTDCYFCHNCENCHDSMFCFNAKNLRYAVCNVEVGKGEYSRIIKLLLDGINAKLEKNKSLEYGIYDISGKAKAKKK